MHKLYVVVVAAFVSAFAIPAFAEDLPVSLSKECVAENSDSCGTWQIRITSRVDSTTIRKVVANRGNCKVLLLYTKKIEPHNILWLPQPLNFGGALFVDYACDPIEVEVTTDQDSFIFTFDE